MKESTKKYEALKLNIEDVKNATFEQKVFFTKAAKLMIEVLNEDAFWGEVQTNYNDWIYKNIKKDGKWEPVSFEEYKDLVMSGKSIFEEHADNEIDIHVTLYYSRKNVVGYTNPRTYFTWFNRKYLKSFDIADMAGHIWHEENHNIGFDHPGANKRSLVYQSGYLMKDYIRRKLNLEVKPRVYKRSFCDRFK